MPKNMLTKILTKIKQIIADRTFQGAGYLTLVQFIITILNFLINIMYSKMAESSFNMIATYFLIVSFLGVVLDFGLKTIFINNYGEYSDKDIVEKSKYFFIFIRIRLISFLVFFLGGFLVFWAILPAFYPSDNPIRSIFILCILGAFSTTLFDSILNIFLVLRNFKKLTLYYLLEICIRIGLIMIIIVFIPNPISLIFFVQIASPLIFSLIVYYDYKSHLDIPKIEIRMKDITDIFKKLFTGGKWVIISNLLYSIFDSILTFFAIRYLNMEQINDYYLLRSLRVFFLVISSSLTLANLTELNQLHKKSEFNANIKKTLKLTTPLSALIFIVVLVGSDYALFFLFPSRTALPFYFKILSIAFIIHILLNPISIIIYPLKKPHYDVVSKIVSFSALLVANLLFFPVYGLLFGLVSYNVCIILEYTITLILIFIRSRKIE
jgi:O-antigen/teichoic acid export membrane protein